MNRLNGNANTNLMTLDETLDLLAKNDVVEGIMLLGTTGTDTLTLTSDYDVLLVLRQLSAPLRMVNTWVDGRLTEVYCTTVEAIQRIVAEGADWTEGSEEGIVLVWLREGRIVFDRDGYLAAACDAARRAPSPSVASDRYIHEAWRKIGYNVAQIKRGTASDDPTSQTAVDMRLLYSVAEVNLHYFTVRRLPWRGEKPAIQHWMEHDPAYLDCLRRFFDEPNRRRKVELYEELASLAVAPVGPLWRYGQTMVSIGAGYGLSGSESAAPPLPRQDALDLWDRLTANDR